MKLLYTYKREEDVWCLLNKGKSSNNSPTPTKVYEQLIASVGENPNKISTSRFVDEYLKTNSINISQLIEDYQQEFNKISGEFHKIAERIFGVFLKKDITVYLTVNNRCPYSFKENLFFVSMSNNSALKTAMHELWHFYTWYKFGSDEQERIGPERYNDIKEALTVLLNVECKHLLPADIEDVGYPQHQKMRAQILELWKENPDIGYIWGKLTVQLLRI